MEDSLARRVPPNIAPPIASFERMFPLFAGCAMGSCIYVLEDRKAFRALARVETGVVVLEVKKFAAGLEE